MAETTKIEWCDATASPWHGCSEVSSECDHCYAAAMAKRNPTTLGVWGDDGVRVKSKSFINTLRKLDRKGEREGRVLSVFPSICDPFEDRPELEPWRREMFDEIDRLQWVRLLLLTKRPENIRRMWPEVPEEYSESLWRKRFLNEHLRGHADYRHNCWLGTSAGTQETADRAIPELLKCRDLSPVMFVSCEPMLGPVDLRHIPTNVGGVAREALMGYDVTLEGIDGGDGASLDWVICGGESGPNARPMHPEWSRSLRDQCAATGVPFLFKQHGEYIHRSQVGNEGQAWSTDYRRVGKKTAGRLLDGVEHNEFPEVTMAEAK